MLYVTTPRRTGAWLAEAFASDSACAVTLEEARGAAAGLTRLREQVFDAVLVSHEPAELDALVFLDALRAGGAEEPLIVLGQASEQEMAALCYESGADAYVCVNTATTRTLLWIVARATERHSLMRENRHLAQAAAASACSKSMARPNGCSKNSADWFATWKSARRRSCRTTRTRSRARRCRPSAAAPPDRPQLAPLDESLMNHYRELLRAHVIMGSGNLSHEMAALAELLADGGVTAPQTLQLHVQVLEELVRGLGSRSARHVMTRADLLVLEVLVYLAEQYRLRAHCGSGATT